MKVECLDDNDQLLWSYDTTNQQNITDMCFLKDGTQQTIITALENACTQAKGQILLSDDVNGVSDICTMTGRKG
ncbi:hypothetical protein WC7_01687 [Citrobacter sp. KTE151]|jgi:hypothetical protein|nr:hypothetical protein WC7_01687 [Citrobacter sp. KTE151]